MKKIKYNVKWFTDVYNPETRLIEKQDITIGMERPYSEANLKIAKAESYNGEYTVEDDGEPTSPETEDSFWDELDAAYQEGVDSL